MGRGVIILLRMLGILIEIVGLILFLRTRGGNPLTFQGVTITETWAWVTVGVGFAVWLSSMVLQLFTRRRKSSSPLEL
jgi:hypothetical protein